MAAEFRPMRSRLFVVTAILAAIFQIDVASANPVLRPFNAQSYRKILATHESRPFVLAFWSIDCPACQRELATLSKLRHRGIHLEIELVATDDIGDSKAIAAVLKERGLEGIDSWAFADPVPERLRFAIDPHWYGELPRSYLFDAAHVRTAHTGPLTANELGKWADAAK